MNVLLKTIRSSLLELELGIAGALNITDPMESLSKSLQTNAVDAAWAKKAYSSLKGLSAWFADLILRVEQLVNWTNALALLKSLWLSGLFNPMSFLTAVMQVGRMCSKLKSLVQGIYLLLPPFLDSLSIAQSCSFSNSLSKGKESARNVLQKTSRVERVSQKYEQEDRPPKCLTHKSCWRGAARVADGFVARWCSAFSSLCGGGRGSLLDHNASCRVDRRFAVSALSI